MRRGISAAFASKLMADFVADAIKVENPRATASAGALCLRQALRPIERVRVLPSTIIPPGKSASRPKTEGPPRKAHDYWCSVQPVEEPPVEVFAA